MTKRKRAIVYFANDGWRWHGRAANGRTVVDSGEAYSSFTKAAAAAFDYAPPGFAVFAYTTRDRSTRHAAEIPDLHAARKISAAARKAGKVSRIAIYAAIRDTARTLGLPGAWR